jgi:hypothetical protein
MGALGVGDNFGNAFLLGDRTHGPTFRSKRVSRMVSNTQHSYGSMDMWLLDVCRYLRLEGGLNQVHPL